MNTATISSTAAWAVIIAPYSVADIVNASASQYRLLAPKLTDRRLRALVRVQVQEHAEERGIAALRASLAAEEAVQMILDVAGADDLAVLVCARDMADYNALAERLFQNAPAVRRYETSFIKRVHKQSAAVMLMAGDGE